MNVNLDWLLFGPNELRKIAVDRARMVIANNDLDPQTAFDKISSGCASDEDYQVAFDVLEAKKSRILHDTLVGIAKDYNLMREEVMETHPLFMESSWNVYKITGVSFRSPVYESMFKAESDNKFARFYSQQQFDRFKQMDNVAIFESWNGFSEVGFDRKFLFGLGQYRFRDKIGHVMESIWDIRQETFPHFIYTK